MTDYERAGRDGTRAHPGRRRPRVQARLLLQVLRTLARGRPVTGPEIDGIANDLGWAPEAAQAFLRPLTERDAAGAIIGVLPGLSLGEHGHRFGIDGRQMSTWRAEDTLLLPALLGQSATVESTSPLSRIWTTFCHHIHFFATREEAARWAAGRGDIAILTPDEGYRLGRQLTSRFLDQAS